MRRSGGRSGARFGSSVAVFIACAVAGALEVTDPLLALDFETPTDGMTGSLVPGRGGGSAALAAPGSAAAAEMPAASRVDPARGTIAFRLRADETLYPAPRVEESNIVVVDRSGRRVDGNPTKVSDKILNVFLAQPGSVRLRGETFDRDGEYYGTLLEYRRLYGDRWYHFAFTWDSTTGRLRQYLNARLEQAIDRSPWIPQEIEGARLLIGNPYVAIDDVRIYDRALSGTAIARLAGMEPGAGLSGEGLREFAGPEMDLAPFRGREVLRCAFTDGDDLADWVMEGPGEATTRDGRVLLRSTEPPSGHFVWWNRTKLPDDILVEFEFSPASAEGLCILFFCARGRGGVDLFDPSLEARTGSFRQYVHGDVEAYHVSWYRNGRAATGLCNLRKDPGMPLLGVGRDPIPPQPEGTWRISVLKTGDRIRVFMDGGLVIDERDEARFGSPHGAGRIGLRHMAPMEAWYDNLVVFDAAGAGDDGEGR